MKDMITPIGKRQSHVENEDGSVTNHILISVAEHDRIMNDATKIRDTFIENSPDYDCMPLSHIYAFLLGTYIREESDGEYQQEVKRRLEYSRIHHTKGRLHHESTR